LNKHQEILNKVDSQPVQQTTKTKFAFESTVFKKDTVVEEKKSTLKKVDSPACDNGNILTWKGVQNSESPVKLKKVKDPNACSNSDNSEKVPKRKDNRMHEASEENGLIRKK